MILGIDIGGTKTAVCIADDEGTILKKEKFETSNPVDTLSMVIVKGKELLGDETPAAIGISCGSPQDAKTGMILEPPNLPGWKKVPVVKIMEDSFSAPAFLMNDANACALAEWKFGAGRGTDNMIFLTFGTGMGAGLIIDGKLFEGPTESAGEVGHMRVAEDGPVGYGKKGSFEGFCSGGGIRQLGETYAREALKQGIRPAYCPSMEDLCTVTAKTVGDAAEAGDPTAIKVYDKVAEKLGEGLSVLIDLFNPETIVIGSIFARSEGLLREGMEKVIEKEALKKTAGAVTVKPAELGENLGDMAAIAIAMEGLKKKAAEAPEEEAEPVPETLYTRYPKLAACEETIDRAAEILIEAAKADKTVLVCGNGGSAADSEHIVGELMKGFNKKRPVSEEVKTEYLEKFGAEMPALQGAVRAISLPSQVGILSAFANDVSAEDMYAQLCYGYAREGDVLITLSTSGNSKNCVSAAKAALMRGAKVIALTGEKESKLSEIADVTVQVPETETYKVQELHLPVYHELCLRVENALFEK